MQGDAAGSQLSAPNPLLARRLARPPSQGGQRIWVLSSVMDLVFSVLAALVASALTVELFLSWRKRPRLHAEVWSMAFAAFALGSWALVAGLAFGWTSVSYRLFFFFGAIATIPLLAAGSIALVVGEKAGRRALNPTALWLVFGFFATFLAPMVNPLPTSGIPDGSEVFEFFFSIDALTLPGPRFFAAISGAVGSIVIVGLAIATMVRNWSSNRQMVQANALIVAGTLVPAFGGTLTAIGESAALAVTLMIGVILLWAGYHRAASARERPAN